MESDDSTEDAKNAIVTFMHEGKGGDMITYTVITLYSEEDIHNFRKHDICLYGKESNITIKKHFCPDFDPDLEPPSEITYGYIIYDGTIEYNNDIIELIRKNLKNRILFS